MNLILVLPLILSLLAASPRALAADPLLADEGAAADNPAPSLGTATPSPSALPPAPTPAPVATPPAANAELNLGVPSAPEAQPAIPLNSIPGKTDAKAPTAGAEKGPPKDIYQQYDDYLSQEKNRQSEQKTEEQRTLFPHENGGWQLGFAYVYHAFSNYNFNWTGNTKYPATYATSNGPALFLLFYPLHSLSLGRFGLGPAASYYWSNFSLANPAGGNYADQPPGGSMYTYGIRAVYEFDYWLGQIVVPYVFGSYDQMFVKAYQGVVPGSATIATDFPINRTSIRSYGAGIHFNLNRVEPIVASRALVNVGIRKFYLTYAATDHTGVFSGLTHSLGLTFEF